MNYAMFSESKHLVEKKLELLIKDLKKKYEIERVVYDGYDQDFNLEEMLNDLNTIPFLYEHKLIILENPYFLSAKAGLEDLEAKLFEDYLKNPVEFSTLVVYVSQFKVDKRKKIVKTIIKNSQVYQPQDLQDYQLSDIIRDDLKSFGITIDNDAFNELVLRVAFDFDNWTNEAEKISLYNKKHLNISDIKSLISRPKSDNVFELVNAVVAKDLTTSLSVWRNLPPENKEPISMIMLLASQFRLIHQIITLTNSNFAYQDLVSELNVHPYRIKMAHQIAQKTSSNAVLLVLKQLSMLEQAIKSGFVIAEVGFELFLIKVCEA